MATSGHESLLLHVYHHIVLPRDVPGREDSKLHQVEAEINKRLIHATKQLALHAPSEDLVKLDTVRLMLSTCGALNVEGKIDANVLATELQQLGDRQALILHVTEQNAALLIYRHLS
jgi:serine phosphatase RsbU (regulator of sigma subunit)